MIGFARVILDEVSNNQGPGIFAGSLPAQDFRPAASLPKRSIDLLMPIRISGNDGWGIYNQNGDVLVNYESTTGNPWRSAISEVLSNGWQSASARFLDELGNWKSVRDSRPGGGIAANTGSIFVNQVNVQGNAGIGLAATLKVKVQTGTICDNEGGNFSAPGGKELSGEVSECDSDGDGISDAVEAKASTSGDANQDGVPDVEQKHVAAVPAAAGAAGVVIASPNGTALSHVANRDNPSSPDSPPGAVFPAGWVQFDILLPTASVVLKAAVLPAAPSSNRVIQVELLLPAGVSPAAYYVYGPTPEITTNHWYRFDYDGVTGAIITGNRIVLHLVDGSRGDDDLTVNNLIRHGAGGPAAWSSFQLLSPQVAPAGWFQFTIQSTAGRVYRIESSTNLIEWIDLLTTNAPASALEIADTNAPAYPRRFYRAVQVP